MMPAEITVRPAVESDAGRLAAIQIAAWRAAYRGVMTDEYLDGLDAGRHAIGWRRNLINSGAGTVHLVAEADDEVVGFAIAGPARDSSDPASGQLYAINVHPDWWAHGAGSALFAAAEQTLIELGYARGFLWVEATNERAIGFYVRRGWLADGGTMQDGSFDPPVAELRHSRKLPATGRLPNSPSADT